MFTGLLNTIDQRLLTFYEMKVQAAVDNLARAKLDRMQLERAHVLLLQGKAAHATGNVAKYKSGWIDLRQAESLLKSTADATGSQMYAEFEKFGTACAKVRRRMAQRSAKVQGRPFGSRTA